MPTNAIPSSQAPARSESPPAAPKPPVATAEQQQLVADSAQVQSKLAATALSAEGVADLKRQIAALQSNIFSGISQAKLQEIGGKINALQRRLDEAGVQ